MNRNWMAALAGLAFAAGIGSVLAQDEDARPVKQGVELLDHRAFRIGHRIGDLSFTDLEGKAGKLSDFSGSKALAIAFRDVGCPLSKKYGPRLARLIEEYQAKGVAFLLLNPGKDVSREDAAAEVAKFGFKARYAIDSSGEFGRELKATRTTDVFVLDASRTLTYRGAIDDQYGIGFVKIKPKESFLREALDASIAGLPIRVSATRAPGCKISFSPAKSTSKLTYHNRIARIMQRNCQECHRPGEVGPFPLTSYKEVTAYKDMIKESVSNRLMPPWFAKESVGHWRNDRSLSAEDRKAIVDWVDGGCPEGDEAETPTPMAWTKGWILGQPDEVLEMPREVDVPEEGIVDYIYMQQKTNYDSDRWIDAFEIRAGAPEVVHHVLVFIRYPKDHPRFRDQPQSRGGLRGYFAGMVPGQGTFRCPPGTAKFLPKGATLVFQMHYTPNGQAVKDRSKMGLFFADKKPIHEFRTIGIANTRFKIPPGANNFEVVAEKRFRTQMRLFSFNPHMHLRGKAFRYELLEPGKAPRLLLEIPRYDFNWQLTYELREPLDVAAGAKLRVTGWFDNSDKNPANPDPKRTVRFGEQTYDEMLIGYVNGHKLP